ncbi:hypothetical protein PTSG_09584 [Salpingoeca rosetta]|uniref:Phospholipase/carboxylesterase/thioesterase domain-containing protein n=1 Tax=Salpingoeca rosetta (strain ATCC 50818 / BSB-021) TaxID=946362 RepID=F2ULF2_SALR5|nr:uncharacterized protein PTSG_09584 [Salpingoeca rosetta]EGD77951.1 hypothetical protein PTSG_09584 [Salpingoeca rosetta]|eukprot:XP_004990014.1 hypothetical protein PTSG_09584 [Salpingoeca rosetta]
MPQSALRAASRTASCSNPKNEKKKKGKQPQAQRRLPAELAKKVKPPPVPKCAASIFRHHHVIKAYRPASPSTGGTRPSPQQQQQQQHHQQQQPVFNVLILLHDGEGTEQEMATLAARMQLSHFHCISVAADSLQDDPLQPTESHPQDSREPLLFVDDGPWFGTRQQQPGKVTVLQSCTQRLLRLVDSLVTQGYSPKGIFLLGIGQGGMAACQCALSLVRQHLHNGTRGSDAPKQTTENDGGGDGSAVGPDPHLPAARVVRDVHALRQQWGADVTLTETPEAAVLSPTAMRAIFGFLGQHMRTVLQHLADAGELVHVAS